MLLKYSTNTTNYLNYIIAYLSNIIFTMYGIYIHSCRNVYLFALYNIFFFYKIAHLHIKLKLCTTTNDMRVFLYQVTDYSENERSLYIICKPL